MRRRTQVVKAKAQTETLKGWRQIASFLGEPISVVQRWARTGMPIARQGRSVVTSTGTAERLAWPRIRQTCARHHSGSGPHRRTEARTLLDSSRKTRMNGFPFFISFGRVEGIMSAE